MDFKLPELGEGVYEAEAVRWLVKPGDTIKNGQTLLEVLTDKATMEVPAPFAGVVDKLLVEAGQKLTIGQVVLHYHDKANVKTEPKNDGPSKTAQTVKAAQASKPTAVSISENGYTSVKAAPSVRQMARKLGIDLAQIRGSGPAGRILIDDLSGQFSRPTTPAKPVAPALDFGEPGTRVKFTGLRRKIGEHMVLSKHTIPHYSYVDECDLTDLVKLRESLKEPFTKRGAKITYLAFFVKAVANALKEVPLVNATLDEAAGAIVLHDQYHVGIAVATPSGLIVPVIHDANMKGLLEIAQEIERLSNDARVGKSKLDDLRGGTFTVTSVGNIGGLISTPIIHHPQVGILGIGKVVKRPVFDDRGQIKPADIVYLSFTFDHRVLDGAVGAAFGNAIIKQLQNSAMLLLNDK